MLSKNPTATPSKLIDTNIRSFNTPKILRTGMFAIWGMGLLWIPISINAIQSQRSAIKTIAKDSVPSVLLSLRIIDAMSDMDATVANALLDDKNKEMLVQDSAQTMSKDQKDFNVRRNDLAERLTLAAKNITFTGEDKAIQQIMLDFGTYLTYVERAQAAHAKGDKANAIAQYRLATTILDKNLIPKAYQLRDINSEELEWQYQDSRSKSVVSIVIVTTLGLMTIGVLVALQLFLTQRTRRTINPLLFVATMVALLFLLNSALSLLASSDKLRVLKEDSYNSLWALRSGRALLYGANSDESRYLLDTNGRQQHNQAFFDKIEKVFQKSSAPGSLNPGSLNNVILKLSKLYIETALSPSQETFVTNNNGYFATAVNNITSDQERTAVAKMIQSYQDYLTIDQKIRNLVASNKIPEALALCLGPSNDAFDKMRASMNDAIKVNQDAFDRANLKVEEQLSNFETKAAIALILISVLVFFGLRPRLREYS
jgi:hypothetical protein